MTKKNHFSIRLFLMFSCTASVFALGACQKQKALDQQHKENHSADIPGLVGSALNILQNDKNCLQFLEAGQPLLGKLDWRRALPARNKNELICIVPYLNAAGNDVNAIAIVSISDSIKVGLVSSKDINVKDQSLPVMDKGKLLLQYWRFRWFDRQPEDKMGVKFRQPTMDSGGNRLQEERAAGIVVSICYDVVVCTADGHGNCVGNYVLYTECTSSTYWLNDFSYTGFNAGGWIPEDGTGTRGGTGGTTNSAADYLLPPRKRIDDLPAYTACFDPHQPAKLVIYVDQPQPGSDEPFTILGKMGHVFCSLEQSLSTGVVRRFFGFHPSSKVNPFTKRSAPSILANDEGRYYDLYLPVELSSAQFSQVLGAAMTFQATYDLEQYNCTDFVLDMAKAGGLDLPRSSGWWIFGNGRNPGRFGEDLRAIPGTLQQKGTAPVNKGSCK